MFFNRIADDFRQKELLPLKMVFFVHSSTVFVLYPYLTIHMRELGINVEETAIMSALTPCIAVLMPPIAGMIADRIGNFKVLLSIFSGVGGLMALLLMLVPVGRVIVPFPDAIFFSMKCSNDTNGYFDFTIAEAELCMTFPSSAVNDGSLDAPTVQPPLDYTNVTVGLTSCGLLCSATLENNGTNIEDEKNVSIISKIRKTTRYSIHLHGGDNLDEDYTYHPRRNDFVTPWHIYDSNIDVRGLRTKKQLKNFQDSIQAFTSDQYYFPASTLFDFECDFMAQTPANNCSIRYSPNANKKSQYKRFAFMKLMPLYNNSHPNEIIRFSFGDTRHPFSEPATCNCDKINATVSLFHENMKNNVTKELTDFQQCKPVCIVTAARKQICKNQMRVIEYDSNTTFKYYLLIRLLIGVVGGTAFAMFEGAVIAILREKKADYGLQRIYASIGGMISSPLSGFLIDYNSRGKGYTDFRSAFYFYALLKILTSLLMLQIDLEFKSPAENVVRDVIQVLKKIEVIALYLACFVLGTAWGYIESFLFWLLQDLGASRSLMGITITIGGITGIPLLVMSGPIIERFGHPNVLFIGFIFYAIRLVGYSLITIPWHCLIFEAMESITSSLVFTAAVTYAAKLSSTETDSSIQGLLGGIYFGVGKGTGSLVGGYLIKYVGSRNTYRIFSVMTLLIGICYFLFNKYYIAPRHPRKEQENIGDTEMVEKVNNLSNGHLYTPNKGCVNDGFECDDGSDIISNGTNNNNNNIDNNIDNDNNNLHTVVYIIDKNSPTRKTENPAGSQYSFEENQLKNHCALEERTSPTGADKILEEITINHCASQKRCSSDNELATNHSIVLEEKETLSLDDQINEEKT